MTEKEDCSFCQKPIPTAKLAEKSATIRCCCCKVGIHLACLPGAVSAKSKGASASFLALVKQEWFAVRCSVCSDPDSPSSLPPSTPAAVLSAIHANSEKIGKLTDAVQALTHSRHTSPTYAAAASNGLPPSYCPPPRPTTVLVADQKMKEEEKVRLKTVILDGVPESNKDETSDDELIHEFISGFGEKFLTDINWDPPERIGPEPDDDSNSKPRKIKLVLDSPEEVRLFLSKRVYDQLRDPDWDNPPGFENVYVSPSMTKDERHYLSLLRRRRDELNTDLTSPDHQWFVDNRRATLVKRRNGRPDWYGPGDTGLQDWLKTDVQTDY